VTEEVVVIILILNKDKICLCE